MTANSIQPLVVGFIVTMMASFAATGFFILLVSGYENELSTKQRIIIYCVYCLIGFGLSIASAILSA